MDCNELIDYLNYYKDFEDQPIDLELKDLNKIRVSDFPRNDNLLVQVVQYGEEYPRIMLEGEIGWSNNKICIYMSHDWYRKWWDYPLSMRYHMDLMKRLLEFRKSEYNDISDIDFDDEGDWCHLTYTIFPESADSLYDVYQKGLDVMEWMDTIVGEAQNQVSSLYLNISNEYSRFKLSDIPDLIEKINFEKDSNNKGRILEELISKMFSQIKGFSVMDRVRTETEEIDIVILNKSDEVFWQKESPVILVECKNWSAKCGKNELVVFKEKLINRRSRAKIGFFISWNGFATTFLKEDLRGSHDDILIIPVTGEDILQACNSNIQENIENWWVQSVNR